MLETNEEKWMNIAVLEDNPAIIEYLTTALQMADHRVASYSQAGSLFDALFRDEGVRNPLPFDVLTVDLLLPGGISGFEVLTRVRRILSPQSLPIMVLSGASLPLFEQIRENFPDVAILRKPFKMTALLKWLTCHQQVQENSSQSSPDIKGV
jgi:DNA-binding response OmpR family regulator